MRPLAKSLIAVVGSAAVVAACGERYVGPWRDPSAKVIPSFADSAFGSGTTWFATRTFGSILTAGLDAQSVYSVEFNAASGSTFVAIALSSGATRFTRSVPGGVDIVSVGGVVAVISTAVSAFDATTGGVKFTYQPAAPRLVTSNGATDGTRIVVGNGSGEVVALNTVTGAEMWKTPVDTASTMGVTVSNGTVFAGGYGWLAALDATTGALKWKKITTDSPRPFVGGAPAVDSGRVSIITYTASTYGIANYDATTGALKWSTGAGAAASAGLISLPACDGNVITASGAPGLAAVTTTGGSPVWGRSLSTYQGMSASCANGTVITNGLLGPSGSLYSDVQVLRSSDGSLLAQYPKAATQTIRIYRVVRNATTIYALTDRGISAIPAP